MLNETQELVLRSIFILQDECLALAKELKNILVEERRALVALETETVAQTNAKKDNYSKALAFKKKQIWNLVKAHFALENTENLESKLEGAWLEKWAIKKTEWLKTWSELTQICETNQIFLKHSLRNFGLLLDNLKRLFGEQPLYTAKGAKVEKNNAGKVVEASF